MRVPLALAACFCISNLAIAQTQEIYRIGAPAGVFGGWGEHTMAAPDLTGDGVGELVVGSFNHGGNGFGSVHSGADGTLLYLLSAPFEALFYGAGLASVADQNGDGIAELIAIGTRSGAHNSHDGRMLVFSGADGSLLSNFLSPDGLQFTARTPRSLMNLGDVDGDGGDDLLCRTRQFGSNDLSATLINTLTGALIYTVKGPNAQATLTEGSANLGDINGDGTPDFSLPLFLRSVPHLRTYSGADGSLLQQIPASNLQNFTGNGEPMLAVEDRDGDGQRDIVAGAVFTGFVGLISSADGSELQTWDCDTQAVPCMGSRLIEVGDLNGNGSADLMALNSPFVGNTPPTIFGLDPATGEVLFSQRLLALTHGYSSSSRLLNLPGVDPQGRATIAIFEELTNRISVRRFQELEMNSALLVNKP